MCVDRFEHHLCFQDLFKEGVGWRISSILLRAFPSTQNCRSYSPVVFTSVCETMSRTPGLPSLSRREPRCRALLRVTLVDSQSIGRYDGLLRMAGWTPPGSHRCWASMQMTRFVMSAHITFVPYRVTGGSRKLLSPGPPGVDKGYLRNDFLTLTIISLLPRKK